MKKFFLVSSITFFFGFHASLFAQSGSMALDTIITKKNEKIVAKITKVTETDYEYKKDAGPDATVYVIDRYKVREIHFSNGRVELIRPDEMDVNQEQAILDKRSAVKFIFFSPLNDQLTFAYEHVIKVGTNLEVAAGLINNSMFQSSLYGTSKVNLVQGGLFKAGAKFLLGKDYYMKGMKYAHPLKGVYFKPEFCFSSFVVRGVQGYSKTQTVTTGYPYPYSYPVTAVSDERVTSAALMMNFGQQFILGNTLTFGYYVGVGYAMTGLKYSNPDFTTTAGSSYNVLNYLPTDMYFGERLANSPLTFTTNLTIGYIFK